MRVHAHEKLDQNMRSLTSKCRVVLPLWQGGEDQIGKAFLYTGLGREGNLVEPRN